MMHEEYVTAHLLDEPQPWLRAADRRSRLCRRQPGAWYERLRARGPYRATVMSPLS